MDFYNAGQQFDENLRIYGNPQSEPEKYNLYAGLSNLAKGLRNLQSQVEDLQRRLRNLEIDISNRR